MHHRRPNRPSPAGLFLLICLALMPESVPAAAQPAPAAPPAPPPGFVSAQYFAIRMVRVLGRRSFDSTGELGFGFVVGEQALSDGTPGLVIVTADHLVRDPARPAGHFDPVEVTFFADLSINEKADILDQHLPPELGDLAVLVTRKPAQAQFQSVATAPSWSLAAGTPAWLIGRPGQWQANQVPGQFVEREASGWLAFSGLAAEAGSAGAAVFTDKGLAGMAVGQPPGAPTRTRVLPVDLIAARIRAWHLPWSPATPEAPPAAAGGSLASATDSGTHTTDGTAASAGPGLITEITPDRSAVQSAAARTPPPPALRLGLPDLVPLLPAEIASRTTWTPEQARLSPRLGARAALYGAPRHDAAQIGTTLLGNEFPPEIWQRGAYDLLRKLDGGAWFLAGSGGTPIGYIAGPDVMEIWPLPTTPAPANAKLVREWSVAGDAHAVLRDIGTAYDLTVPVVCKRDFCDTVALYTPPQPAATATGPGFMMQALRGAWTRDAVAMVHVLLPRRVVEAPGARLLSCIGPAPDCDESVVLPPG